MMGSDDGRKVLAAFSFVRDVYANAARMLYSADDVMQRRGCVAYGSSWKAVPDAGRRGVLDYGDWVPYYVIRQYSPTDTEGDEVVTLAAVFYDPEGSAIVEPLCIASRMAVTSLGDDLYWLSLYQMWLSDHPADGSVRVITADSADWQLRPEDLEIFQESVAGQTMLSVAIPLLQIKSLDDVEKVLVMPLLGAPWPPSSSS